MTDCPELSACKVLRKYLPKLAKTLDPAVLATELHSIDIVDDRTWEEARKTSQGSNYDRCLSVLEALIRSVRAKPDCFDKFCEILDDERVGLTKDLACQLREEVKKVPKEVTPVINGKPSSLCTAKVLITAPKKLILIFSWRF